MYSSPPRLRIILTALPLLMTLALVGNGNAEENSTAVAVLMVDVSGSIRERCPQEDGGPPKLKGPSDLQQLIIALNGVQMHSRVRVIVQPFYSETKNAPDHCSCSRELCEQNRNIKDFSLSLAVQKLQKLKNDLYEKCAKSCDTPLADAIGLCRRGACPDFLEGLSPGRALVVYITDGKPDCGAQRDTDTIPQELKKMARRARLAYLPIGCANSSLPSDGDACVEPIGPQELRGFLQRLANNEELPDPCSKPDGENVTVDEGKCETQKQPMLAAVAVGGDEHFRCSGTVIDSRHVLTARHCLPATRVLFGERIDAPLVIRRVLSSTPGPKGVDVALLTLDGRIPNVAIPFRTTAESEPPRGRLRYVGFGARDVTGRMGFGVKTAANIYSSSWGCTVDRARTLGCDPSLEMVVTGSGGRDTCNGDSGGPLFERALPSSHCRYPDPEEPDGLGRTWRLVGVTSRAIESARSACGEGGVYVRLDRIADWLESITNDHEEGRQGQ